MIAVVVTTVLVMIAFSSYEQFVLKSRRALAKSFLIDVSTRQQLHLLDARIYATSLEALNTSLPKEISNYYTARFIGKSTQFKFKIQVTPKNGQEADLGGAPISIDSEGVKSPESAWN